MNEMRKLMENLDQIERGQQVREGADDLDEIVGALNDVYEQLLDAVSELENVIRAIPDQSLQERGRRMVLAHFQTALNSDHSWLGGNMTTLADFIEEIDERSRGGEDYDEY